MLQSLTSYSCSIRMLGFAFTSSSIGFRLFIRRMSKPKIWKEHTWFRITPSGHNFFSGTEYGIRVIKGKINSNLVSNLGLDPDPLLHSPCSSRWYLLGQMDSRILYGDLGNGMRSHSASQYYLCWPKCHKTTPSTLPNRRFTVLRIKNDDAPPLANRRFTVLRITAVRRFLCQSLFYSPLLSPFLATSLNTQSHLS